MCYCAPLSTSRKYRVTVNIKRTRYTGLYYVQESNTRLSASSRHLIKLHIDDDDIDDKDDVRTTAP
jgi:hypothetical protein